ncbi:MAG: M20/M25/M40 family metallo-hydrolase [Francisellaceae bacterium]
MTKTLSTQYQMAIKLLSELITMPSVSTTEDQTATHLAGWFFANGMPYERIANNVYSRNKYYDANKPTILLLSHHDTVSPSSSYTRDPFVAEIIDDKLYGLGSNDAGGALVTMLLTFSQFYHAKDLPFNLIVCAAAEEENSGTNGISRVLPELGHIDFAIVGEPTSLQVAIAEKGLIVCDCIAIGKAGHAARGEGDNAIIKAMKDILWLNTFQFDRVSPTLGAIKLTVSIIEAGSKHNVVPDRCHFVLDIRTTDAYTNQEVIDVLKANLQSEIHPRSIRLKPSAIDKNHPLVQAILKLGSKTYGSPTTSDQAVLNCPRVKFSPGDSARSHMADEFIYTWQIKQGLAYFNQLFTNLSQNQTLLSPILKQEQHHG